MEYAIDSHFHMWDLNKFHLAWLSESEAAITRDVLAEEYERNILQTPVKYGIFVQCIPNSIEEALWVLNQKRGFIKGVVAGLTLADHAKLKDELEELSKYPEFVGCRHFDIFDDAWLAYPSIMKGIQMLEPYDKTFDFNVQSHQLKHIHAILSSCPNQQFVVDHIGKPKIKDRLMEGWKQDMEAIAKYPNAYCKISGLVSEADLSNWAVKDFVPFIQFVLDIFGVDRCMFGSDWPVCTLANASYKRIYDTYAALLDHLTPAEQTKIFQLNAKKIYKLAF